MDRDEDGHTSDCAIYNEPAFPAGPCDCQPDAILTLAEDGEEIEFRMDRGH